MNEQSGEVQLLMDYLDGKPIYEAVPSVKIGENRYRIISSPGFAPGVANGDEIELVPSEKTGYRILTRGGNICIQLFLYECSPDQRRRITELVSSIGGWLDGGKDGKAGHLLIYTIPSKVGFDVIEGVMSQVSVEFSVDKWMYGNVYDTRDGVTPLNWWLMPTKAP